jgi:hypothetical protein
MGHDGTMRTLRQGTGQWTCMPGHADPANPDPMCGDKNAMEMGYGLDEPQGAASQ